MPEGSARRGMDAGAIDGQDAKAPASHPGSGSWRQDIIRQALAAEANNEADAKAAAKATVAALQSLFAELEPLLGGRAMRALYGRSLYLARSSFAEPLGMPIAGQHFLEPLHTDLASRKPEDARQASETLLVTFSDLLITFLGESIALRALRSAWGGTAMTTATRDKAE